MRVTLQLAVELVLAGAAVLLLARDLHRAWLDQLRRPITVLVPALFAAVFLGAIGSRPHPQGWWLALPSAVLLWEAIRGWRKAPRCHLREGGIGAFALSLLIGAVGFTAPEGSLAVTLWVVAAGFFAVGAGLWWRAVRREPVPWRAHDPTHYERRSGDRPKP